jgi:hypothetical protein
VRRAKATRKRVVGVNIEDLEVSTEILLLFSFKIMSIFAEPGKVYKRLMEGNDTSVRKMFSTVSALTDAFVHVSKIRKHTNKQEER